MTETPRVTIGLPVYNSERYVRQSIESLLAQSYFRFVLIISDNASTDATQQICQEFAKADPRVRYYRNPVNIGNPGNFNRVFELATTPYLKWATADDFWEPTFVERAVEVLDKDPTVVLCYPSAFLVDAAGANAKPYDDCLHLMQDDPGARFRSLVTNIGLAHQHLGVIRTAALRRTHLLGQHVASDINLLAELTLYGKFFELPDRLFYRRFHQTSGSWKRGDREHEAKHYYGANSKRYFLRTWRSFRAFLIAVGSAPLPLGAKARLAAFLLRRMLWSRGDLGRELVDYARYAFRPAPK